MDLINLFRTLAIILIIYYVGKLFTRYILPALFYNFMNDKMKEFNASKQRQQRNEQQQARKREGQVTIEYEPEPKRKNRSSKGDYVDYEEIKD